MLETGIREKVDQIDTKAVFANLEENNLPHIRVRIPLGLLNRSRITTPARQGAQLTGNCQPT